MKTLDRAFVRTARQRPWQFFMADGKTPKVSFGSALIKTVFIARRLRRQIGEQPMVGLLLPPSVGGALTNYALMLMGRVPVNLNYTSSNEVIASCAQQCGIDVVITSKAFRGTLSEYGDSGANAAAGRCAGRAAIERKAERAWHWRG